MGGILPGGNPLLRPAGAPLLALEAGASVPRLLPFKAAALACSRSLESPASHLKQHDLRAAALRRPIMNESIAAPTPRPKRANRAWVWVLLAAALVATPFLLDYVTVGRPVSVALAQDEGTGRIAMSAHRQYRVNPGVLVISVGSWENAAPADFFRGILVAADVLHDRGADFQRVHLARGGKTIFTLEGSAFRELGEAYGPGQNSLVLVGTIPEKLKRPDGRAAFRQWTGGSLEAFGKQLEDVTAAVGEWTGSGRSRASY